MLSKWILPLLLVTVACPASEAILVLGQQVDEPERSQDSTGVQAPKTVEEGLHILEAIFGAYDPESPRLWWITNVRGTRGKSSAADIVPVWIAEDFISYGTPYRIGERVAIDSVNWRRSWSYDEDENGARELIRSQQRHSVFRYTFRLSESGDWFSETEAVVHSNPRYAGLTTRQGTVTWEDRAVVIRGFGTDTFMKRGGKVQEAPVLTTRRFEREDDQLVVTGTYQYREFTQSPEGEPLRLPDLTSEPLTDEFAFKYVFGPREVGEPPVVPPDKWTPESG